MATSQSGASSWQGVLPAPSFRRAGDYVYVSSIFPLDQDGNVVQAQSVSPYVGESVIGAQTRACLERLRAVLTEAGTTLDRTVKAEVYLIEPEDFYEFKVVWQEYFPDNPPARTTAVVGHDQHIVRGSRLNLQAVAVAGNSSYSPQTVRAATASDPMAAEHAPQAVKAGPFVFLSGVSATDYTKGLAVTKQPGFPIYGSDPEMQANYAFQNMGKVLEAAGSGLDQGIKSQLYEPNLLNFHQIDAVWGEYMQPPPNRSSMGMQQLLVPGTVFLANFMFLAPDEQHQKHETRAGIRWHPVDVRRVNFTPGIMVQDWLFTAGQVPIADFGKTDVRSGLPQATGEVPQIGEAAIRRTPPGLPHHFSDIELQTEFTMGLLQEQLEGNGYTLGDVVDARVYLVNAPRDFRGFDRAWRRIFAPIGYGPSMSIIPSQQADCTSGIMFPGPLIEIDLISKKGG